MSASSEGDTQTTTIRRRHFQPDVPGPLLAQCKNDGERWMYEQQSIQRQQNEAIMDRLEEGEKRFDDADAARKEMKGQIEDVSQRLIVIEKVKDRISAKSAVVAFILCSIFGPIILAWLGAFFLRWLERAWK